MRLFKGFSHGKSAETRVTDKEKTMLVSAADTRLSYQIANFQMIGARERQEDSFAVINATDVTEIIRNGMFAIVADGMGGMKDGKLVSEMAVSELVSVFHALDRGGDIPEQLRDGIYGANRRLCESFAGEGGTTAVMVFIRDETLHWASVGDSSIFLRRDGGLFLLNKEHTYLNELYLEQLYRDDIDKAAAESDEDRLRLSGFLGMDGLEEIDCSIRPLQLRPDDVLLLCSDGISGVLSEAEIYTALSFEPTEACARLNDAVIKKHVRAQDNYTGLIIACKQ